jgi:hypothetical protein
VGDFFGMAAFNASLKLPQLPAFVLPLLMALAL